MTHLNTDRQRLLQQILEYNITGTHNMGELCSSYPFFYTNELSFLDYMTIRDLRELGGYQDDICIFAVLMTMFEVLQEGSLCLSLDKNSLSSRLQIFMEKDMAEEIANQFLTNLAGNKYDNLIAKDSSLYLPLVLYDFAEKKYLYFQKFYFHENRLKDRIKTILQAKSSLRLNENQQINLLQEILSDPIFPDSTINSL